MTSTICQGIQSFVDPWIVEKRVLTLRLAAPDRQALQRMNSKDGNFGNSPPLVQEIDAEARAKSCKNAPETGCYSFGFGSIQPASNTSKDGLCNPPLPSKPRIRLSKKSLELCTENLGCETGTGDAFEESIPSSSLTDSRSRPRLKKLEKKQQKNGFPPPLTTMSGQDRIRLKPQREDGRLVLKAVPIPPPRTFFQAKRSDGHLRLQFLRNAEAPLKEEHQKEEEKEEGKDVEVLKGEADSVEEELENGESIKRSNPDGIHGNEGNDESGKGVENFQRPSRCKEGGTEELIPWEPFWVAT